MVRGSARGEGGARRVLLVALTDGAAQRHFPVVDTDVEPALGVGAYPHLVSDRGPFAAVVRERQQNAALALQALREAVGFHHVQPLPWARRPRGSRRCPALPGDV